jgi:Na+-translocating ferredoxin:NAD+ oxidoreductase RnfC subunit
VDVVIANGAECEPLMHKDAELMARYPGEVIAGLRSLMDATGAREGIIGIKAKHTEAVSALEGHLDGTGIRLHLLGNFYPTGDEFVLVYETTGRLIPPGGFPLAVGAVVQNVETLYNIAAAQDGTPVTRKFLTVAGAVKHPLSCDVPIGISFREVLGAAGGLTVPDAAVFVGGAMMGRLTRDLDQPVTKTTGGLIALPGDHPQVARQERPEPAMHRIGKSACDQCSYCTELCPRYLLGYAIEPHKVMRSLVFSLSGTDFWNRFGMLCCECGLCTLYACPEDLYPREACQSAKRHARSERVAWTPELARSTPGMSVEPKVHGMYEARRIPLEQLIRRLGLVAYDVPAPFADVALSPRRVRLLLKQHAGAPATPVVRVGQTVSAGEVVADVAADALGAPIHASISGIVRRVEPDILIETS